MGARLGDKWGRKKMFIVGMSLSLATVTFILIFYLHGRVRHNKALHPVKMAD